MQKDNGKNKKRQWQKGKLAIAKLAMAKGKKGNEKKAMAITWVDKLLLGQGRGYIILTFCHFGGQ